MANEVRIRVTAEDKASKELGTIAEKAKGLASTLSGVLKVGAAAGAAGIVALGVSAVKSASDFAESQSKVRTVFGASSKVIEDFAAGAAKNIGLSNRAALDATGTFGNMFTQLRIGQPVAADMSTKMVQLASDFASFHNADISDVIIGQTAAFRGEYDALQRFVPTINAAAVNQKAMAMTGKENAQELTAQEKALATYELILKGAGAAQGDFARTSDGLANRSRTLAATWDDLKVKLGQQLAPVVNQVLGGILEIVQSPGFDQGVRRWTQRIGEFISAVAQGFNQVVIPAFNWIVTHKESLVAAILAIGAAFAWAMPGGPLILGLGAIAVALAKIGGLNLKTEAETLRSKRDAVNRQIADLQAHSDPGILNRIGGFLGTFGGRFPGISGGSPVTNAGFGISDELKEKYAELGEINNRLIEIYQQQGQAVDDLNAPAVLPELNFNLDELGAGASSSTAKVLTLKEAIEDGIISMAEAAELHLSPAAAGLVEVAAFLDAEAAGAEERVFNLNKAISGLQYAAGVGQEALASFTKKMVSGALELSRAAASAIFGRPTREEAGLQLQIAENERMLLGAQMQAGLLTPGAEAQKARLQAEIDDLRDREATSDSAKRAIDREIEARERQIKSIDDGIANITAPYERLGKQLQDQLSLMENENKIQQLKLTLADQTLLNEATQNSLSLELTENIRVQSSLLAGLNDFLGQSYIPEVQAARQAHSDLKDMLYQVKDALYAFGAALNGNAFDQRVAQSVRDTAQAGGFRGTLVIA